MVKSGLTRDEVEKWGGPEVFNQALAIVNAGDVVEATYDDDTLEIRGKIAQPSGWDMPVSFTLKPGGQIESHCTCDTNRCYGMVCMHVVAIGLVIAVREMDDVEPERTRRSGADGEEDAAIEEEFIEVETKPKFFAFVQGSRASLSIELDAHYGDIEFPACSVQSPRTVYLPDPDDPLVRRVRSMKTEREAVAAVQKWGFEKGYREGDLRLYLVDPQKVLDFLGAGLPALRRRGWRVDLADKLMELTDSMPSVVPVVTVRDAPGGAFDVSYTFDAMGREVSPVEIQAALNRGDGYIMHDGEVVLLDNTAIEAMHAVFRDCATSQNGAPRGWFRVSSVHAPYVKASLDLLDSVDLDDMEAPAWRETAAARNRDPGAKFEPVDLGPLDMVLRPYQKQGVYWMSFLERSGLGGLLADEMGLGKTLQTLTWLSLERGKGSGDRGTALIVCPTSLVRNWEAEAKKFTPWLKVLVVSGPDRADVFAQIPKADVVVTSYALLQRDFEDAYLGRRFSAVVLDEAQHIKNRQTKNAKAVKLLDCERRLVLTGTPVENSVADVWSIFDFLMPDYLGDYETFKCSYEEPIAAGGAAGEEAQERLRRKLHPFIMRRLKKSVAKDLPDKIVKVSYCPMSEDAQREYNDALAKTRRLAGDMIRSKGLAKSRAKLEAFMEQLESAIEGGHKILVFSQFVKMLKSISEELQERGIPFCYLDGSTKDRLGECNRFNRSPEIPVFGGRHGAQPHRRGHGDPLRPVVESGCRGPGDGPRPPHRAEEDRLRHEDDRLGLDRGEGACAAAQKAGGHRRDRLHDRPGRHGEAHCRRPRLASLVIPRRSVFAPRRGFLV